MNHWLVYRSLLLICSGYALLRGGGPERAGAVLMLLAVTASTLAISPAVTPSSQFSHLEVGLFIADVAAYGASLLLMVKADRFWTIWMSALFGTQLLAHLLAIPDLPSLNLTYAILERIWGYPLALLPAIGAVRHQRRLKTYGVDRSWSVSSDRSRTMPRPRSPTS